MVPKEHKKMAPPSPLPIGVEDYMHVTSDFLICRLVLLNFFLFFVIADGSLERGRGGTLGNISDV